MLHIIHVNDTEGEPAQVWPRLATAVRRARAAGRCDLLLHGGDVPLDDSAADDAARAMSDLAFDAIALGNHDLVEDDAVLRARMESLNAPVLCANVIGAPPGLLQPYRVLQIRDWRVAVVGVTLGDLPRYLPERQAARLSVRSPEQALADLIPRLRAEADILVVLSHQGVPADEELARRVPGIDLIMGGHDHRLIPEPVRVGDTWVAQAGSGGEYVGSVEVCRSGGRVRITGGCTAASEAPPDPEMLALLAPREATPSDLEVVGYTATAFGVPGVDARSSAYWRETALGNLTVDLMRAYAGTELALLRCASVVNELPAGPIRRGDLRRLNWSGGDQVARFHPSGRELMEVLESGARGAYFLLLTSGARVVYDGGRDEGSRVRSVRVGEGGARRSAPLLELDRTYSVACSEILANGVSDFPVLAEKPREVLPHTVQELLTEHILTEGAIRPRVDGRLSVIGPRLP